jgi:phosphate transport system protein
MAVEVRRNFHNELDEVRDDIVRMAGLVSEALARATRAFLDGDLTIAEEIIDGDDEIDDLTLKVEEHCYQLLALQQPMASDLRALTTAIRLSGEIERSGDLVTNIMKGARRIYGTDLPPKIRGMIESLSSHAHRLFRLAIDSYVDQNVGLASALDDMDDEIDKLHVDFIESIFETHESGTLPLQVAVQLALIGRFYERIGDHSVNIGERVRYLCTGWLPEHTGAARQAVRRAAEEERHWEGT